MPSFDVVSEVDLQEVDNAVNQARKEIDTRYDFRGSNSKIEFDKKELITLHTSDKMKLQAMTDILNQKISKRGVGVRALEYKEAEEATMGSVRQQVLIKQGINSDDAKKIVKLIKDEKMKKVQAQIQQEQVRVTGPKRDDLQAVITLLKDKVDLELQFTNFRD